MQFEYLVISTPAAVQRSVSDPSSPANPSIIGESWFHIHFASPLPSITPSIIPASPTLPPPSQPESNPYKPQPTLFCETATETATESHASAVISVSTSDLKTYDTGRRRVWTESVEVTMDDGQRRMMRIERSCLESEKPVMILHAYAETEVEAEAVSKLVENVKVSGRVWVVQVEVL